MRSGRDVREADHRPPRRDGRGSPPAGGGYVYINGRKLEEPYLEQSRRSGETYGPTKIPRNSYFMMGDNRSQSCDSREWGSVPRGNLIGKVFATYWPPNRISLR